MFIKAKVHEEMDAVLGDKMPTLCDRPLLIRFEAAMMESQRLRSVTLIVASHMTAKVSLSIKNERILRY